MSTDTRPLDPGIRGSIEALAERVDSLAAMVRETGGSLAASRGEVASLDRRVQERIGQDNDRAAAALVSVQGELDALRSFVAEAPKHSGTVVAAASDPLRETVQTLADRIETLADIVRSTSGRLVAEQSRISVLTEALARGDERVEARFSEMQRGLEEVAEQAARATLHSPNAPAKPAPSDPGLEQRVGAQVNALVERVDFLAGTAKATAGKLAAKEGEFAHLERRSEQTIAQANEAVRSMRSDLETLVARLKVDPMVQQRVDGLVDAVQVLGDRVGTLSGIVGETAGRAAGRETEIAALDHRLGHVGLRIDDVARELRRELDALGTVGAGRTAPAADQSGLESQLQAFGLQLGGLEALVADASGAAEQVGADLRVEIAALATAVAQEQVDLLEATREWEERRSALEGRMDELATFATSTAARGAAEMGQALHTLAERLERLEQDRQVVASDASYAESAWEQERAALEARLDEIAAAVTVERPHTPEVELLVDELAGRLARMEGERESVADLAALAETWTAELAALEARVDEGLSTLEEHGAAEVYGVVAASFDAELSENVVELTERIAQIERDRDAVRQELARTATAWATERASLEERVSEFAALATSSAERGADEMGRALHTLADRLERLEQDRQAVASDATLAESAWENERAALEARLDTIAAAITGERAAAPEVEMLVDELAGRLARMEGERETVADLAALAETWTAELAALEARVDEGLSTLEVHGATGVGGETTATFDTDLGESLDELTQRIEQIERDRDAVRNELTRTATSWASERAALQERVSELAARIVTGPMPGTSVAEGDAFAETPQELDRLRIGVEGLRMRLAYHEKTVYDLAGSRGVVQRLDELSARLDQLSAIVAAGPAAISAAPGVAPTVAPAPRMQVPMHAPEAAVLVTRLEEAERVRDKNRDKMLEQMEKIASRMDWRLQRLETAGVASDPRDS